MIRTLLALALLPATPALAGDFEKGMTKLFRPAKDVKAPSTVTKPPADALCGVPAKASADTVVLAWGLPSGLRGAGKTLVYKTTKFTFSMYRWLETCELHSATPGLAGATLAGGALRFGETMEQTRKRLGAKSLKFKESTTDWWSFSGTNEAGLSYIRFSEDGKLERAVFSPERLPGYKKDRSAPAADSPWSKTLKSFVKSRSAFALPEAKAVRWKGKGKKVQVAGVPLKAFTPDATIRVWGLPTTFDYDSESAEIRRLKYESRDGDEIQFDWRKGKLDSVDVRKGRYSEALAAFTLLPKGILLGASDAEVLKTLGKTKLNGVKNGDGPIYYRNYAKIGTLHLHFEPAPDSKKGVLRSYSIVFGN